MYKIEENKSGCCNAKIERDFGGIGVFSLTSGSLICSKCKKYCVYKTISASTLTRQHIHDGGDDAGKVDCLKCEKQMLKHFNPPRDNINK